MSWYEPIRLAHLNQMTIFFMIMLEWRKSFFFSNEKILHGHDSKLSQIAMIILLSVSKTSSLSWLSSSSLSLSSSLYHHPPPHHHCYYYCHHHHNHYGVVEIIIICIIFSCNSDLTSNNVCQSVCHQFVKSKVQSSM